MSNRFTAAAFAVLRSPLWLAGVAGSDKSFADNPILGSATLNRWGLHRRRLVLAERLADWRRSRLARFLSDEDRAAYDRDGIVVKRGFLPEAEFAALKAEIAGRPFAAREMRQGRAVERMIPLGQPLIGGLPAVRRFVEDPRLEPLIHYVSSRGGRPIFYLQTVIVDPGNDRGDPQTNFHTDTFHSTTKAWYFLTDVAEDEGPFTYVPGSHRLTPERLEWEYRQSLTASTVKDRHHAVGSFRVREDELARLGCRPPVKMAVPANTLVVADTHGFHARGPSARPTARPVIHAYIRRNPFLPWTGLDPLALPGISARPLDLYLGFLDARERLTGKRSAWRPVGEVRLDDPASI
jgi:hypothetical protein